VSDGVSIGVCNDRFEPSLVVEMREEKREAKDGDGS
jgi:hypothetical protein